MSIIPYGRTYEQENPHRPTIQSPLAGSPVLADLEYHVTSPSAPPSIASFQTEEQYSISSGGQDFERKPWDFLDNEEEEIMDQPLGDNPPVIVIIPSSFSNESLYEEAISRLETVGYEVIFAQLPSIVRREELSEKLEGDKKNITLATMEDDARFIKEISTLLSDDGKDVVLVSHSYSGIPMTESVQGSTKHEREAEGKVGGVVALVYISAFIPTVGESLMTRMMELHPGETDISHIDEYGIMSLDPVVNARSTFSDLPEDEGVAWSNKMENHSAIAFAGKTSYEGWRYIPVTYLHTENDKVIPLRVQIDMVEQVRESGINVEVVTCGAGHCPNVSAVEEFVEAVRKGAGERRALSKPKTSIYVETNTQVVTEQYSQEPNGHPPLEPNGEDQNYYRDVRTLVSEFERMGR